MVLYTILIVYILNLKVIFSLFRGLNWGLSGDRQILKPPDFPKYLISVGTKVIQDICDLKLHPTFTFFIEIH